MRAGIVQIALHFFPGNPLEPRPGNGDRRADQHNQRRNQNHERGHLHFVGLDLLAQVFRRAADHQPGHEHGHDDEHQHAVEPAAHAAEHDFAELHQPHRHQPAERRERIVHRVDAAVGGAGCRGRPQAGIHDAEPRFLALHVAARLSGARHLIDAHRVVRGHARLLLPDREDRQRHEDHEHRGQHGPTLPRVADHHAERVAQARPRSAESKAARRNSTAASGSRTDAPSSH